MRPPPCPVPSALALALLLPACVARAPAGAPPAAVYLLPFPAGTSATCVQEGPGPFSHEGSERYAVDFGLAVGSPVVAARGGRVVAVKEDSDRGGPSRAYAKDGNRVLVEHPDGTRAVYLHLEKDGAPVEVGEFVRRGQEIGRSGYTGWSAVPHLHFEVDARDPATGPFASVPVRFADVAGDGAPRWLVTYESGNAPPGP